MDLPITWALRCQEMDFYHTSCECLIRQLEGTECEDPRSALYKRAASGPKPPHAFGADDVEETYPIGTVAQNTRTSW